MKNGIVVSLLIAFSLTTGEELKVISATPDGDLYDQSEATAIQVSFNLPMVQLSALPDGKGDGPLQISPAIEGRYRWKGTDVLVFTPDNYFIPATEYRVIIPAGTKSQVNNAVLKENYSFSFRTPRPKVIEIRPQPLTEYNDNWYSPMHLDQPILLQFNLPVKIDQLQKNLQIEPPVDVKYSYISDTSEYYSYVYEKIDYKKNGNRTDIIKIMPKDKWKKNTQYSFTIKSDFKAEIGTLGLLEDFNFWQKTFGPLEFKYLISGSDTLKSGGKISPEQSLMACFNNELVLKDLIPFIHFSPDVTIDTDVKESTYESRRFDINFSLAASTTYTVTIDPGLKDIYGNTLGQKKVLKISTDKYSPYIKMVEGHGIVEAVSKHRIPIDLVNVQNVPVYLKRISSDNVVSFLQSQNLFNSSTPTDFSGSGGWTNTTVVGNNIPLNKKTRVPLYLDPALEGGTGMVYAMLEDKTSSGAVQYQKSLLQVTNLGITAKFGYDNTILVVSALDNGSKLSNVSLEIRDTSNAVLWTGITGNEGMITAPSWKSLGIQNRSSWSAPKIYVIAKKEKDWSFISSDWGSNISPYRFNIDYQSSTVPPLLYSGTVITDRDLYRPGETVYCKGLVRYLDNGSWTSVKHSKIEVVAEGVYYGVTSDNGESESEGEGEYDGGEESTTYTLFSDTLTLNKPGSFECKFKIPEDAHLMDCTIKAHIIGFEEENKGGHESVYGEFRIAEFRPAELEVAVRTNKNDYTFGDKAEILVSANYLHGAPVKESKMDWVVRRSPLWFSPEGYDGYSFFSGDEDSYDNYWYYDEEMRGGTELVKSESGETDKDGKLKVMMSLDKGNFKGSAVYEIQTTVEGKSAQPVSSRKTIDVHAGEYYIGLKPSTSFGEEGKPVKVSLITVNYTGERTDQKSLNVKVVRRIWQSVRKAGVDGRWSWESEKLDSICFESKNVNTNGKDGTTIEFTPQKSGYYVVTVNGKDKRGNTISCMTTLYVTGLSYAPWLREDDDILELIADKKNYSPGETARILVKSPYKNASAIVTIEREGVIDSRWVTLQGTADKIVIPIKKDYLPNVFVSVIIIRGRTIPLKFDSQGEDLSKPSYKIGYIKLRVSPESKHLAISVQPSQKDYRPGDSVSITLKVDKLNGKAYSNEALVMAVDEGVLLLSGYKTPDPFKYFYKERPLSVITTESRASVIGERNYGEKGQNRGGGGGLSAAMLSRLSDVKVRGNYKVCAYFNPKVKLDKKGEATVKFKLPDNLTTFRVMAVVHSEMSEFGGADARIRVNKKMMVRPLLPRFLRVNDSVYAGVIAENYSSSKDTFFIKVDGENVKIPGTGTMKAMIPENGQSEIRFPIIALPGKDTATLTFKGILGENTDGAIVKLPIVLERTMETVALSGATPDSVIQKIKLPDSTFDGIGSVTAGVSSTAMIGLNGGVSYLFDYPYGCLEQKTSKVLPLLLFEEMVRSFNIKTLKNDNARTIIQSYFDELANFQTANGGFDYWTPASHPSPYLTAYVLLAIVKGGKKGFALNTKVKQKAIEYLSGILNGTIDRRHYPYSEAAWYASQAFTIAVLAEEGKYEPDDVERLYKKKTLLSLEAKCDLVKAITFGNGDKTIADDLGRSIENAITIEAATAHYEEPHIKELWWVHESNVKATAIVLQTMLNIKNEYTHADKIVKWLMKEQKTGRWRTTQENIWVFWALADYFDKYEKETPDFTAKLKVDGKEWMEELFKGRSSKQRKKTVTLSELSSEKEVDLLFSKEGTGRMYYEIRMQYARKDKMPARNEGFSVNRRYFKLDGKEIRPSEFITGQVLIVKLEINNDKDHLFVAVNDAIPAGCEIIDPLLAATDREIANKVDIVSNGDNDYWWGSWNHTEYRDQRCLLFADYLNAGSHTFSYAIRPIVAGTFYTPATYVEEMYSPEVFGRGDEVLVQIKSKQ